MLEFLKAQFRRVYLNPYKNSVNPEGEPYEDRYYHRNFNPHRRVALAEKVFKEIELDFTAPEKWVDISRAMGERNVPREGNTDSGPPIHFPARGQDAREEPEIGPESHSHSLSTGRI